MIVGKKAAKNPSEQHSSEEASEHNYGGESGIHRRIVTRLSIYREINLAVFCIIKIGLELLSLGFLFPSRSLYSSAREGVIRRWWEW